MEREVVIHDKTIYIILLEERIKEKDPKHMISTSLPASIQYSTKLAPAYSEPRHNGRNTRCRSKNVHRLKAHISFQAICSGSFGN
jgi:hypothetical protein